MPPKRSTRRSAPKRPAPDSTPQPTRKAYETFYHHNIAKDKAIRQLIDHKLISKGSVIPSNGQAVAIDERGFNVYGSKSYVAPIHQAVNTWRYDDSDSEDDEDPLGFEGHRAGNGKLQVSIKRQSKFLPDRLHGVQAIMEESNQHNSLHGLDDDGEPFGGEELSTESWRLFKDWNQEPDESVNPHTWNPKPFCGDYTRAVDHPLWEPHPLFIRQGRVRSEVSNFKLNHQTIKSDYKKFGLDITKEPSGESFPFTWEFELGLPPTGGASTSSKPATRTSTRKRGAAETHEPDAEDERPTKKTRKDTPEAGDDTAKKSESSPTRKSTRTRRPTRKLGESTELPTKKRKANTPQDDDTDTPAPTTDTAPKKRGAGTAGLGQERPTKRSRNDTPPDESDDNDDSAPTTGSSPKKRGKGAQSVHQGPPSGEGPPSQHAYIVRALAEPNAKMFQEAFYRLLDKDPHNVAFDHEPYIRIMEGLYKGPPKDIRDSIKLERGRKKKPSPPSSVQDGAGDDGPGKGSSKKRPHSSESEEESSDEDDKPSPPKKVRFILKGPRGPPPSSNGASSSNASQSSQTQPTTTSAATSQPRGATTQHTGRTAQGNRSAAGHGTAPYTYEEEIKLMELAKLGIDNATLLQRLNTWLRRPNSGCTYQRQGDSARQHASVLMKEGCTQKILRTKQMSWRQIKAEARKNGTNPGDDVSDDEKDDE